MSENLGSTACACAIGAAVLFSACAAGSSGGTPGTVVPIQPGDPGNADGTCPIPAEAMLEDVSNPTTIVGTGTPDSCTPEVFIAAVAAGGSVQR